MGVKVPFKYIFLSEFNKESRNKVSYVLRSSYYVKKSTTYHIQLILLYSNEQF